MVRLYSLILSQEKGVVKSFMRQLDIRMELKNQAGGEGHENLIHLRDLKNSYAVQGVTLFEKLSAQEECNVWNGW
jgi:hypothetical protein